MKKIIPSLVIIILILLIVIGLIVWKINSPKYSYDDVANLLLKGIENMDDMNNVTFEMKNHQIGAKYYYKENKMKMELMYSSDPDMSLTEHIINLEEGKQYTISEEKKFIGIQDATSIDKGIQYQVERNLENRNTPNYPYKYEYRYIRDEILDGKDCILVEEIHYKLDGDKYVNENKTNLEKKVYYYWIEKTTGLIIGYNRVEPNQDTVSAYTIITNMTFGNVKDSDFELPTGDYITYEVDK